MEWHGKVPTRWVDPQGNDLSPHVQPPGMIVLALNLPPGWSPLQLILIEDSWGLPTPSSTPGIPPSTISSPLEAGGESSGKPGLSSFSLKTESGRHVLTIVTGVTTALLALIALWGC